MHRSHVLVVAALVLTACGSPDGPNSPDGQPSVAVQPIPEEAPSIVGTITAVPRDGSIRVEERPDEEAGSAKAVVRLTSDTRLLDADGRRAARADLVVGRRVRVWFTGPVAESYPVQATAGVVVIEAGGP